MRKLLFWLCCVMPCALAAQGNAELGNLCEPGSDTELASAGLLPVWGRDRLLYLHNKQQLEGRLIIDVRPAASYDLGRIPGSINLPLHTLPTKSFLKQQPILLVGDGRHFMALEQMATRLKKELAAVTLILDGSLHLWQQVYGGVDGVVPQEQGELEVADFFAERDWGAWLLLDASQQGVAPGMKGRGGQLLRLASSLTSERMSSIKTQISRFHDNYPLGRLLLIQDPAGDQSMTTLLQQALPHVPILSVRGGSDAVRRYLADHELTLASVAEQEQPQYCRPLK